MMTLNLESVLIPSEDIVAREIEGELIIVPLVAGIGDMEDELFSLNEYAKVIWRQLDGKQSLDAIVDILAGEYDADREEIAGDVLGFVGELTRRGMLVEV
jgi:hypothetical protein